jgi:hypothetical protein
VLTRDREDVVLDLDLDLLGLDPGDVSADDQMAVLAHDVDRRRPCALASVQPLVEHAIEASTQLAELGERIPTVSAPAMTHLLSGSTGERYERRPRLSSAHLLLRRVAESRKLRRPRELSM